ncbi:hypothetical protein Gpo141_00011819 [Globisporangium polare]
MTQVKRVLGTLNAAWGAVHVERHGKYSVERLRQLNKFQNSRSLARSWLVIALTPLPCLAAITLLDTIPLKPPSLGFEHSQLFWVRAYLMTWMTLVSVMVQFQQTIPRLGVTSTQILLVASAVSTFSTAVVLALAKLIGFPVPFTIALSSIGASLAFIACLVYLWGRNLQSDPDVRLRFVNYVVLVNKMVALIYIYSVFSYVFNRLDLYPQAVFALLLPVLKLVVKNWISSSINHMEDLKPEAIVFNVEVFHALYVAYSMQMATSQSTIVVLMVVDFVHAYSSFRRLSALAHVSIQQSPSISLDSSFQHRQPERPARPTQNAPSFQDLIPGQPTTTQNLQQDECTLTATRQSEKLSTLPKDELRFVDALSPAERLEKVESVLQLLHMTEFVVLVEYTEVMIPVVYCLYLLVMSHLPNRVYYSQLKDLSAERLGSNIHNILVYAFLELVSFLLLSWFLGRKLRTSSIHQLAFVLENQWQLVQSKLILWVVFAVQSSLQHFGADYSFQFRWLHADPHQ